MSESRARFYKKKELFVPNVLFILFYFIERIIDAHQEHKISNKAVNGKECENRRKKGATTKTKNEIS